MKKICIVLLLLGAPVPAIAQSPDQPPTPPQQEQSADSCANVALDQRLACRLGRYQFQQELAAYQIEQLQRLLGIANQKAVDAQKKVDDLTKQLEAKQSDAAPPPAPAATSPAVSPEATPPAPDKSNPHRSSLPFKPPPRKVPPSPPQGEFK